MNQELENFIAQKVEEMKNADMGNEGKHRTIFAAVNTFIDKNGIKNVSFDEISNMIDKKAEGV